MGLNNEKLQEIFKKYVRSEGLKLHQILLLKVQRSISTFASALVICARI